MNSKRSDKPNNNFLINIFNNIFIFSIIPLIVMFINQLHYDDSNYVDCIETIGVKQIIFNGISFDIGEYENLYNLNKNIYPQINHKFLLINKSIKQSNIALFEYSDVNQSFIFRANKSISNISEYKLFSEELIYFFLELISFPIANIYSIDLEDFIESVYDDILNIFDYIDETFSLLQKKLLEDPNITINYFDKLLVFQSKYLNYISINIIAKNIKGEYIFDINNISFAYNIIL